MNTPQTSPEQPIRPSAQHQLGYWLRAVDHAIKGSMHDALTEDGLGRRAWRTLSVIESGATSVEQIDAALPQRRRGPRGPKGFGRRGGFGRGFGPDVRPGFGPDVRPGSDGAPSAPDQHGHHGPRGHRRSTEEIVMDFAARGWVTIDADGIALTDAGREAHSALRTKVEAVRQTVTDAVSPEDLATTLSSLESIARAFGWDEGNAHEHGPRGRFGRGPRGHRDDFGHRGHGRGRAERCGHEDREHAEQAASGPIPDDAR